MLAFPVPKQINIQLHEKMTTGSLIKVDLSHIVVKLWNPLPIKPFLKSNCEYSSCKSAGSGL